MNRFAGLALCTIYVALAPLCLGGAPHASMQMHAHTAGMHMAGDAAPVSLAYHAGMYQTFAAATFVPLLALLVLFAAGLLVLRRELVPSPVLVPLRYAARAPDRPPELARRLSLFTHAPPARR